MSRLSPIPVVAAAIERDGYVLIAQRPAGKHLALKWEFPGGKVEKGEKVEAALIREISEELGSEIEILHPLAPFVHHYETLSILMRPFRARLSVKSPAPQTHEHAAIRWVKLEELENFDLAEADWAIVDSLGVGCGLRG